MKFCIAAAAIYFIYRQVKEREQLENIWSQMMHALNDSGNILWMVLIIVLMILNWSLEAIKWKRMISKIENISFVHSLEAVLAGLTISFFTPNRIGEYAGRVFYLERANKVKAILITIVECLSQLVVTIAFGSVALCYWLYMNDRLTGMLFSIVILLCGLTAFMSVFVYLNIDKSKFFLSGLSKRKRMNDLINVFSNYSTSQMFSVLMLAALRYFIFSFQFYLFIRLFGLYIPPMDAFIAISLTFFTMTVIPTVALAELGVRGAVASFYFLPLNVDTLPVIFASAALWLVNLVLPSLVGSVFILKMKLGLNGSDE